MASYSSVYAQDRPELIRGSGAERKCSCPSPGHEDRKPSCSVNVDTGKWCCHGCGESGHVVEWLRLTRGLSGPEALQEARQLGFLVTATGPHRHRPGVKESLQSRRNGHRLSQQSNPIEQAPPCVLPDQYAACYRYRAPDGTEYARVYRDPANRPGRKADPYTLRTSGPHAGTWAHRAPQDRWPYRIETLSTGASVVIVEGEKCADALAALAEGPDVLTWMGGSSAVLRTNWNGLAGREVTLWPDDDEPGKKCMARLADELGRIGAKSVQAINPEQARPTGWDVADAITTDGWGWEELERYLGRAEEVHRGRDPAAETGRPSSSGESRRDSVPAGGVGLGAVYPQRSGDLDGRSARLRKEFPEYGPGGVFVAGRHPVLPSRNREYQNGDFIPGG